MSRYWLVTLGVGAFGSLSLLVSVRRLFARTVALREAIRPLRVESPRGPRRPSI